MSFHYWSTFHHWDTDLMHMVTKVTVLLLWELFHIWILSNQLDMYIWMSFRYYSIIHHSDMDWTHRFHLNHHIWIRYSYNFIYQIFLLGGAVVVRVVMSVSHREPVYNGGHWQYGVFPLNRHVPPDKQYPTEQPPTTNIGQFVLWLDK